MGQSGRGRRPGACLLHTVPMAYDRTAKEPCQGGLEERSVSVFKALKMPLIHRAHSRCGVLVPVPANSPTAKPVSAMPKGRNVATHGGNPVRGGFYRTFAVHTLQVFE